MRATKENIEKGKETERMFKQWLDNHNIPYLYIHQEKETFSSFFKENLRGKRPDFMLLIPYFGFIFAFASVVLYCVFAGIAAWGKDSPANKNAAPKKRAI